MYGWGIVILIALAFYIRKKIKLNRRPDPAVEAKKYGKFFLNINFYNSFKSKFLFTYSRNDIRSTVFCIKLIV